MRKDDLLKVILDVNKNESNPVDEDLLKQILSIVILNPFEGDRGTSQAQIDYMINQKLRRSKHENNQNSPL